MQNIQSRYSRSLNLQVIDHLLLLAGSSTANKQLARSETRPVDYNNVKQRTATCKLNVEHIEPIVVETCISARAWAVRTLCVKTFVVTNSKSGNFIICSTFGSVAFTGSKNVRRFNALHVPLSEFHWPTASELQSDCNRRSQVIACDLKERNEREVNQPICRCCRFRCHPDQNQLIMTIVAAHQSSCQQAALEVL